MTEMQQPGSSEGSFERTSGRHRLRIVVVVLSVGAAIAGAATLLAHSSGKQTTTQSVVATLRVPGDPNAITAGPDALWAALALGQHVGGGKLVRINLATGAIEKTLTVNGVLGGSAVRVADSFWVGTSPDATDTKPGTLLELNWRTGAVEHKIHFNRPVFLMVYGDGKLWAVVGRSPATIVGIDPATAHVVGEPIRINRSRVIGLAFGEGAIWATGFENGALIRIDPNDGSLKTMTIGGNPVGLTVANGSVWVTLRSDGTLARVDAKTMRPIGRPIHTGNLPTWVAALAGSVWVANQADGTVVRINAKTGAKIGAPIRIAPPSPDSAAAHALSATLNSLWVASMSQHTVSRIDPSR